MATVPERNRNSADRKLDLIREPEGTGGGGGLAGTRAKRHAIGFKVLKFGREIVIAHRILRIRKKNVSWQ